MASNRFCLSEAVTVRNGKQGLVLLTGLLFILLCASFTDRPLNCSVLNTCRPCYSVNYNQQQADASCSSHVARPLCHVTHTDHLDRQEFVASQLLPPTRGAVVSEVPIAIYLRPLWWDQASQSVARLGRLGQPAIDSVLTAALLALPHQLLLDIGSGLGTRSLLAGRLGHRVVAVDADFQNAIRLSASAAANGFERLVRVYWNSAGQVMDSGPDDHCTVDGATASQTGQHQQQQQQQPRVRQAHLSQLIQANELHLIGVSSLVITLEAGEDTCDWLLADATGLDSLNGRFDVAMVMTSSGSWTADKQLAVMRLLLNLGFSPYRVGDGGDHGAVLLRPLRLGDLSGTGSTIDIAWIREGSAAPLMRSLRNVAPL